jgi:hypothetical protein
MKREKGKGEEGEEEGYSTKQYMPKIIHIIYLNLLLRLLVVLLWMKSRDLQKEEIYI